MSSDPQTAGVFARPVVDSFSMISVLLAVRNEEIHILRCLEALDGLDYPHGQIEILIGNDASTDRTEELVLDFIKDKPRFRCFTIAPDPKGVLKGKTNVLAQLALIAKGDCYLFTDADIAVPENWVTSLLAHFRKGDGMVVGVTRIRPDNFLARMQSIEWLYALGVMRLSALAGNPVTGMGNNMAVTADAYRATGGYEEIGFSIVEDYALFKAMRSKGFGFRQAYSPAVVAESTPMPDYIQHLNQRKRWMAGVMQAPLFIRLALWLSAFFLPSLLVAAYWFSSEVLAIMAASYVFVTAGAAICLATLRVKGLYGSLFIFWFYFSINTPAMLVYYLWPTKLVWKGRQYGREG